MVCGFAQTRTATNVVSSDETGSGAGISAGNAAGRSLFAGRPGEELLPNAAASAGDPKGERKSLSASRITPVGQTCRVVNGNILGGG